MNDWREMLDNATNMGGVVDAMKAVPDSATDRGLFVLRYQRVHKVSMSVACENLLFATSYYQFPADLKLGWEIAIEIFTSAMKSGVMTEGAELR